MASATAAHRYADAMIQIASEAGAVEQIGTDLGRFEALLGEHEGMLGQALASPVFTVDERRKVLDAVLPKLELHHLTSNLVRLVNDKGRLGIFSDIAAAYQELADERAGRLRVVVQTAEPMSDELQADVKGALEAQTGKTIVIEPQVDPELIGGMIARVGGKVYDSSVRTRLHQIKNALLQGATPAQA